MMRIGLDFDNTLIDYDRVFLAAARERGLVAPDFTGSKREVRDAIRLLPDGELAWQRLQGHVYGAGIGGAVLFDGADQFLQRCRARPNPAAAKKPCPSIQCSAASRKSTRVGSRWP